MESVVVIFSDTHAEVPLGYELLDLPNEILQSIMMFLPKTVTSFVCTLVCRTFYRIAKSIPTENIVLGEYVQYFPPPKTNNTQKMGQILCEISCKENDITIMERAKENGYYFEDCMFIAAKEGNMKVIEWLLFNKAPFKRQEILAGAIEGNKHSIIKYAIENKIDMTSPDMLQTYGSSVCDLAARDNNFDLLKLAVNNGTRKYPWSVKTCVGAVSCGNLEMLKWLRKCIPQCPWDESVCIEAAKQKNQKIMEWLRSQNPPCPWNENVCIEAADKNNLEMLKWLRAQTPPCPWDSGVYEIAKCKEFTSICEFYEKSFIEETN